MTSHRLTASPTAGSPSISTRRIALLSLTLAGTLWAAASFAEPETRAPVRENREIRSPVRSSAPPSPPPRQASPPPPPRQASPPPPPPPSRTAAPVDRDRSDRIDRDRVRESVDRRRFDRERWRDERELDRGRRVTPPPPAVEPVVGDDSPRHRGYGYGSGYGYGHRRSFYDRYGWSIGFGRYEPCYYGFYSPFFPWPSFSLASGWGWGWPRRSYPAAGYYGRHGAPYERAMGAIDVDVRPDDAIVFVNGQPVGEADELDGFPRYLWLEEGTYDIAVYLPGYQTLFRQVTIYPGLVIDIDDALQPGEAIHPDDYGPTSTEIRDERLRQEVEKRARAAEIETERAEIERTVRESLERSRDAERAEARPAPSGDAADIGRLVLDIDPPDAAVYLDGYFLGLGGDVSQLRAGFVLEPGDHRLEVSRPGFRTRDLAVTLDEGERLEIVVEMEPVD